MISILSICVLLRGPASLIEHTSRINYDDLPVSTLCRSLTARMVLDAQRRYSILCCRSGGHSAMRESLFVPSFCSLIPAEGRVCQHTTGASVELIVALKRSGRVLLPVAICVRDPFDRLGVPVWPVCVTTHNTVSDLLSSVFLSS